MLQVDVGQEITSVQPMDKGSTLNIAQTSMKLPKSALTDVLSQRKLSNCKRHGPVYLLLGISVIFGLSWLPLNIVNVWMDAQDLAITQKIMQQTRRIGHRSNNSTQIETGAGTNNSFFPGKSFFFLDTLDRGTSGKWIVIIQTISLSMVLCSACANPILYGWLNTNFRKEFCRVLRLKTSTHSESITKHPVCAPDITTRVADKLIKDCGGYRSSKAFHSVHHFENANQSKSGSYELDVRPVNELNSTYLTMRDETDLNNKYSLASEKEQFTKTTSDEFHNNRNICRENLVPTVVYPDNLETCDPNCSISNEFDLNFDETDVITQTEFLTEKNSTMWNFQGTSV
ncbi:hypothetical protein PHET_00944 [Paragonimus heterotremus]|uniref:G-protein coupled receptors family 1 profile domain-containing protein n=1 Tax=Paragonimus heterotremus TaxID=100268 RepID=A0A8J4SUH3_9TREM|nr:hypothetical protein PHET_00944 [Paragonimus heterotremus]